MFLEIEIHTGKQTDRQTKTGTGLAWMRQSAKCLNRFTEKGTQTGVQTDRQTNRRIRKQADRGLPAEDRHRFQLDTRQHSVLAARLPAVVHGWGIDCTAQVQYPKVTFVRKRVGQAVESCTSSLFAASALQ